jgi:hypothetical protein
LKFRKDLPFDITITLREKCGLNVCQIEADIVNQGLQQLFHNTIMAGVISLRRLAIHNGVHALGCQRQLVPSKNLEIL